MGRGETERTTGARQEVVSASPEEAGGGSKAFPDAVQSTASTDPCVRLLERRVAALPPAAHRIGGRARAHSRRRAAPPGGQSGRPVLTRIAAGGDACESGGYGGRERVQGGRGARDMGHGGGRGGHQLWRPSGAASDRGSVMAWASSSVTPSYNPLNQAPARQSARHDSANEPGRHPPAGACACGGDGGSGTAGYDGHIPSHYSSMITHPGMTRIYSPPRFQGSSRRSGTAAGRIDWPGHESIVAPRRTARWTRILLPGRRLVAPHENVFPFPPPAHMTPLHARSHPPCPPPSPPSAPPPPAAAPPGSPRPLAPAPGPGQRSRRPRPGSTRALTQLCVRACPHIHARVEWDLGDERGRGGGGGRAG